MTDFEGIQEKLSKLEEEAAGIDALQKMLETDEEQMSWEDFTSMQMNMEQSVRWNYDQKLQVLFEEQKEFIQKMMQERSLVKETCTQETKKWKRDLQNQQKECYMNLSRTTDREGSDK